MENFVYVAVAVAYLVYQVVKASNKNKAKQNRPPASVRPPAQQQQQQRPPQTLAQQQQQQRERESRQREAQQQQSRNQQARQQPSSSPGNNSGKSVFEILRQELEGRNAPAPKPEPMERDPFLEEDRPRAKPVPSTLRQEREHEKKQGYGDEKDHFSEDRLVKEFTRLHAQGKQISHHTHDYFDDKKDGIKGKMQIARAKSHPINKLLKGQKNVRNAIILKEILDRKF